MTKNRNLDVKNPLRSGINLEEPSLFKRLYNWTLEWAKRPHATYALFVLAFIEASFFPIPPDALLIVLALSLPSRAFWYALVCSIGSVVGGCFGYLIGYQLFEHVGEPIINFYGLWDEFNYVSKRFHENAFAAITVAGFTPIPYKLFTIAAGVCRVDFSTLVLASILSRSARFFAEAVLIHRFGERVKVFIERYFNLLTVAFVVLIIAGYLFIKLLYK